ncbi:MAG: hypothetical protein HYV29_09735 [Ignavibacteriales bacterium]|nr:hypothetical protein [Ignavibacteriales bacterium]
MRLIVLKSRVEKLFNVILNASTNKNICVMLSEAKHLVCVLDAYPRYNQILHPTNNVGFRMTHN